MTHMVIRKVRGSQSNTPNYKIRLTCLHEVLLFTILNHLLAESDWSTVNTNDVSICVEYLKENIEITLGPSCEELGMFLKTCISVLNNHSHMTLIYNNSKLFNDILSNLQLNRNNATFSKCSIFKLPFSSHFILPARQTTYFLVIEITRPFDSPSELSDFMSHNLKDGKSFSKTQFVCVIGGSNPTNNYISSDFLYYFKMYSVGFRGIKLTRINGHNIC